MSDDNEDYTDEEFDFEFWWKKKGSILLPTSDHYQKEIAKAAWKAAWRLYAGLTS